MEKEIVVRVGKGYGKEFYYPICDFSRLLCVLIGTKSLTIEVIKSLRDFGFSVKFQGDESLVLKNEFDAKRK